MGRVVGWISRRGGIPGGGVCQDGQDIQPIRARAGNQSIVRLKVELSRVRLHILPVQAQADPVNKGLTGELECAWCLRFQLLGAEANAICIGWSSGSL